MGFIYKIKFIIEINTVIKLEHKLLVTLLCMVNTPESPHCRPVPVCYIRLLHFAAAIKCHDLVSGIGYSTLPYFGPLGRFWYSALTPSKSYDDSNIDDKEQVRDLGIMMSNTATFTLHIRNIV